MADDEVKEDTPQTTAFTIDIGPSRQRPTRVPPRLLRYQNDHSNNIHSKEELNMRLANAEQRRKAYEKAKLDRIHERSEECHKIDAKVQVLLAQDAKRQGLPGTEHIKAMSTRQAATAIKSLAKDFSRLTSNLTDGDSMMLDSS